MMANSKYQSPWFNLTFSFNDVFNIPIGFVLGGMAAIQTNTANYYCSKNTTAAQLYLNTMTIDLKNNQITSAVQSFYAFLQIFDNIVISCTESVLNVYIPQLFIGPTNNYFGENFLLNILYNLGF